MLQFLKVDKSFCLSMGTCFDSCWWCLLGVRGLQTILVVTDAIKQGQTETHPTGHSVAQNKEVRSQGLDNGKMLAKLIYLDIQV